MAINYSALTGNSGGTVFGNKRVTIGVLTTGATTATTACGLKYVDFAVVTPMTASTGGYSSFTSSGQVTVASCSTGDTFNVLAFGK